MNRARSLLERRALLDELRSRQAKNQQRRRVARAPQVLDQVQERRLRPVHVLEDEHERPFPRRVLEEAAHGPEGLTGRALGQLGRLGLANLCQDLGQREEGRAVAVGDAPASQHRCASVE